MIEIPRKKKKRGYLQEFKKSANKKAPSLKLFTTKKQQYETVYASVLPVNFVSVILKRHKDSNGGHQHVILENIGDKHVSVGLTSRVKKGRNSTNYKCETDVLGNGKKSFLRRQGIVDPINNYDSPRSATMTEKDYARAKIYGERAKQKYFNKRKK